MEDESGVHNRRPPRTGAAAGAGGDDENAVLALRACLRRGDEKGAHAHFARLTRRLLPRIERRAARYFDRRPDLAEDAIAEALVLLYRKLADLRDLSGLRHFERRFDQALKSLMLDAFAGVRRGAGAAHETADTSLESEPKEGGGAGEEAGEGSTPLQRAVSEAARKELEASLGRLSAEALLARLPDPRHAEALAMDIDGTGRAEIAAHYGVSERTVYTWIERARETLRAYVEAHLWAGRPDA